MNFDYDSEIETEVKIILNEIIEHTCDYVPIDMPIEVSNVVPIEAPNDLPINALMPQDTDLIGISLIDQEDDSKLCVICLDDSDTRVKNIKELKNIEKTCDCNFNVHVKCFHKWIRTTPACPYCHELILIKNRGQIREYQRVRSQNNSSDESDDIGDFNGIRMNLERRNSRNSTCSALCGCIYLNQRGIFLLLLFFFIMLVYSDAIYF
jgi:DNA-directed RNA polymerase subunit RPC12/RpoP